jgi:TonB family protein
MRLYFAVIVSLIVHALFYSGLKFVPQFARIPQPIERIEFETIDSSQDETQVVRDPNTEQKPPLESPTDNKESPFKSAQTIRVQEQSRAAKTGITQNRSTQTNSPSLKNLTKTKPLEPQKQIAKPERPNSESDIETPSAAREIEKTLAQDRLKADLERGLSTIGNSLPDDIKIGAFTALNTDRYMFYSFYSRIEELIRYRWEAKIQNSVVGLNPAHFTSSNKIWTTYLEVWIKPTGELHSTHLMKESGIKTFDNSALISFQEAKFFPNPPSEMIKEDGLIHLKYAFSVHYDPIAVSRRLKTKNIQ